MTRASMIELFQMRECLEGFAARLAARQAGAGASTAWLAEARSVWEAPEALDNALAHMENNVPFHDSIVAMAGNARLASTLALFQLPAYRLQFLRLLDRGQRELSASEHLAIIDAIVAGREARAEQCMRTHVRRAAALAQEIPGLT